MLDTVELSHLEQTVYFACLRHGEQVIDTDRASQLANISRGHAIKLLASMARKGALYRVGRGQYVVIPSDVLYARRSFVADPYLVVDEILAGDGVHEYYVAYQSAAFVYGAARQLPQSLFVAVPAQRRSIALGNSRIEFVKLQQDKLFGYAETSYHEATLRVSDHEKTMLDCLDRVDLCGGIDEVSYIIARLATDMNDERLLAYLPRMASQSLIQRLGFILERLSRRQAVADTLIAGLAGMVGQRVCLLDRHGPAVGPVDRRWRVRENAALAWEA